MKENINTSLLENLSFPPITLKLIRSEGKIKVFDRLRKKFFCLTDEEFVRQNFVSWLIDFLHYPASLMANEIGISLNGTRKRCDTVVFSNTGNPLVVIEYKSPSIKITQDVFDQIVRYNIVLTAPYLIVSNGLDHFCCKIDHSDKSYVFLNEIPDYNSLLPS